MNFDSDSISSYKECAGLQDGSIIQQEALQGPMEHYKPNR